jgi:hypothetical protein
VSEEEALVVINRGLLSFQSRVRDEEFLEALAKCEVDGGVCYSGKLRIYSTSKNAILGVLPS